MTTQILLGNGYGLALATDSAVTIGNRRTFETSEKLICLPPPHSVAVLVSGAVTQFTLPIQVLIREWIETLGSNRLRKISDYRENFLSWLRDKVEDFPEPQARLRQAFWHVDEYLRYSWSVTSGSDEFETTESKTEATLSYFHHWLEEHRKYRKIDHFTELGGQLGAARAINDMWTEAPDQWPGLEARIDYWFDDVHPSALPQIKELSRDLLIERAGCWETFGDSTGVTFAGYGSRELIPHAGEVTLMGGFRNWVSTYSSNPRAATGVGNGYFLLRTIGQTDYIDNILRGYRSDVLESALGAIRQAKSSAATERDDAKNDGENFTLAQPPDDLEEELWDAVERDSEERLLSPLRHAVSVMPLRSLAEAARSLVGVEALGKAISAALPTTGGRIEVATITRAEGVRLFDHYQA